MNKPHNKNIILSLYALLIACMGGATIVGKLYGEETAGRLIYGSWWFTGLWAVLVLIALIYLIEKNIHKRLAVMLLHVSFVLILIGALVTHLTSESGSIHLRKDAKVERFVNADGKVCQLPFTMTMSSFNIDSYPGTDAVMDYRCGIVVENGEQKQHISVSMNNIGKMDGYRFYQSSYDSDMNGVQLLVAHDPYGIAITYIGYICLLVSLLWTMFSKHTRIRELYRRATKAAVLILMLAVTPHANAQEAISHIDKDIADDFGNVAVLYNGRICPLNTAASDFVTMLCGKSSWNGLSANEIFVGWMIYYTEWESQKIIKVKSSEVQRLLGIEGRWAAVNDFYTANHEYKLSGKANDTNLPSAVRKAIRETDEKMQVVAMFYNSEMLHIFPLTVNGQMAWHTPGSTQLPLGTPEAEFQFINHAMDYLTQYILVSDVARARELIAKIRLYQREKAGNVMPSATTLRMEVLYNSLQQAHWPVYLFLLVSLLMCIFSLAKRNGRRMRLLRTMTIVIATLWISTLLALRWWISGHVPMSNGAETMLFMAWATLVISVLAAKRLAVLTALAPVVSAFCMLVATLALDAPKVTSLMPVLQSPLLTMHVAVVMISYALFALITLIAIYAIILFRKRNEEELSRMTALSQLLLYPAIALLTVGIFIGAVWANVSWGTYWSWDPKETWALITLMVYAVPLHRSFMPTSEVKYHVFILLSFLAVLMTYFGVNFFLPGMHSYA